MRHTRSLTAAGAAVVIALTLGGMPAPLGAATDSTPATAVPLLDSAAQRMVALAGDGVRILQSERAASPNSNGGASFPARTNTAAAKLSFRASPTMVRASMGAPLAAIGNWLATGSADVKRTAIADINSLLASQTQANGTLANSPDAADIDTMFFATHLGMAAVLLGNALPSADRTAWTKAVTGAADFLVANRNLPKWDPVNNRWLDGWYTNGNIVIGNALVEALAYKLTGVAQYKEYYERALEFAVAPRQGRWPGYGFITVAAPNSANGSDGRGYFTEGGATPGFDPDYTMLQADQLSRLFQVTGDPQVLRLLNMVTNQLLSRTNTTTWMMDGSNGSRHNYPSEVLDTAAIATLASRGGRTDLQRYVDPQSQVIDREFRQVLKQQVPLGDRYLYALGTIPVTMINAAVTKGVPLTPVRQPTSSSTPVVTRLTATEVTPVVTHGASIVVSGALTRPDTKKAVPGQQVYLQYRRHGAGAFVTFGASSRTSATGAVSFRSFRPGRDVDVRLIFPRSGGYAAATSASHASLVRRKVSLTTASTTPARHRFALTGSLTPAGARKTVYLQRRTGRTWTTVSKSTTSSTHYRFTTTLKSRGTYAYRVYLRGDTSYASSVSNTGRIRIT